MLFWREWKEAEAPVLQRIWDVSKVRLPWLEGTSQVKSSAAVSRVKVSADGHGVVSHAGVGMLRELADLTGLSAQVTAALADTYRGPWIYDPGAVFADLAAAVADGADCIDGVGQRCGDREHVFGPAASTTTMWRLVDSRVDAAHLPGIRAARTRARMRRRGAAVSHRSDDSSDDNDDDSRASRHLHLHDNRTRTVPVRTIGPCLRIRRLGVRIPSGAPQFIGPFRHFRGASVGSLTTVVSQLAHER